MISFLLCLAILVGGYFVYGKIVDNTFGPDDRETPAVRINDGVDYVVMPQWKLFLVQLLNIAGLGPIFGAMQGALWGPVVFLWITFGTIFAGGVHDYFSGMMSERNDGASIAEITGKYLGPVMQNVMRVFSVVLLIMVGTVFAVGPAGLIVELCSQSGASGVMTSLLFWLVIILTYYFIATFISIDAVIGKIYPVFGICLIIMAIGVIFGIFTNPAYTIPEIWDHFGSMHPSGTPIWSFMFITVACGAISGFHSTQSPLMARCMKSEKQGHFVFYGAMVCEGVIALIWAAAGCSLYEVTDGLNTGLAQALAMGQSKAIYDVCSKTMGGVGIALAMIGVVVCPITSGDTAFRSARLTLADWFKIDQDSYGNRLKLCIPVLGVGAFLGIGNALGKIDYTAGIYCLVASFTGYFTSLALGTEYEANVIASVPNMTPRTVVIVVISAIIFGLTARLFAWSVRTVKSLYGRFITNYLVRALIGALVVLAAYALLDAWDYAGLSTWLSGAGFAGNTTLADAVIKLVVTALTLGAGFQGGEVTPLFGIGAALGGWIGCLTGLDPSFLAALGMLGVFCAGLNVPITTCMMAIDLFHGTAAGFFVIVAFISYLTGGHRGVYPAQRIISPKRRSLIVDEGGTVADAIERHNDLIE